MRWDPGHESADLIDRRGEGGGGGFLLPLIFLLLRSPFGWVILILLGVGYVIWRLVGGVAQQAGVTGGAGGPGDDQQARFVGFVLDDVQNTWERELAEQGAAYRRAKLVLFTNSIVSGCGYGDAQTGPFYCPADQRVYIDLSFYEALQQRLGAPGDFAQAYVIAHEIGHHVQKLSGTSDMVHRAPARRQEGATGLSVKLELQADCYAGVWAHSADQRKLLEVGDIDEALNAAAAIGDDRLQRMSRGTVSPETFSHGTSEQRSRWFRRGYQSGDPSQCDTFAASSL